MPSRVTVEMYALNVSNLYKKQNLGRFNIYIHIVYVVYEPSFYF